MCLDLLHKFKIFISIVSNLLVPLDSSCSSVLVALKFRRDVIILSWWSKRGKSGIFLLSLLLVH